MGRLAPVLTGSKLGVPGVRQTAYKERLQKLSAGPFKASWILTGPDRSFVGIQGP